MSDTFNTLDLETVVEPGARQGFYVIKQILSSEPLVNSRFKLLEIAFTAAGTFKVAHGLGFTPKDVLQSSIIGAGALTWNYAKFDSTNLSITVTGACTVRAFIGAYRK